MPDHPYDIKKKQGVFLATRETKPDWQAMIGRPRAGMTRVAAFRGERRNAVVPAETPTDARNAALLEPGTGMLTPRLSGRSLPAANSLATAMALSASAGYLDAFTYIGHGHVFASAMTGNLVLLGVNLAKLDTKSLNYAFPVLAYVLGVAIANIMGRKLVRPYLFDRPHVVTLLLEIAVLLGVAFSPLRLADQVLVSIITVSTAMQNTSFRNIGTRTYNSVIMTGNIQNFSNHLVGGVWPFDTAKLREARDLGAVIVSFLGGAAFGAAMTPRIGLHAVVLPAALLTIGACLLLLPRDATADSRR